MQHFLGILKVEEFAFLWDPGDCTAQMLGLDVNGQGRLVLIVTGMG